MALLMACSMDSGMQRFASDAPSKKDHPDYFDASFLRFEDHIYQDRIRTVRLHQKGWEQGAPIIGSGSNEQLVLSFDDLEGDVKDYQYRFIHCNADWEASSLQESAYLNGFFEDRIIDNRYSFDTEESYTHYELLVPNERMRIERSGNYLLYVYRDTGAIEPVLTRRFMVVSSNTVEIEGNITRPTRMDRFDSGQQLRFQVRYPDRDIPNPMRSLTVVVQQNRRWDNAVYDPPVSGMTKNGIEMGGQGDATIFDGINEFRGFDTKFLSGDAQHVRAVKTDSNGTEHVFLKRDKVRGKQGYYSEKDINGGSFIRVREASDPELSAEYVKVHFTLQQAAPLRDGTVHVYGQISDHRCLKGHRMHYDEKKNAYKATLYLKQGYHEYLYAYLPDDASHARFDDLEGNFYETENDYRVLVYYRANTDHADRLVGTKRFGSRNDKGGVLQGR